MADEPNTDGPKVDIEQATTDITNMMEWMARTEQRFTDAANLLKSTLPDIVARDTIGNVVDLASGLAKGFESFEATMKAYRGEIAKMKELHMPTRFDDEGVTTFNTDQFRVSRTTRVLASIIADEKEDAFEWLRENDYEGLIKPTVNASSLSGAAKELMENGMELPDDMFRVHTKNGVSITVKKPSRGS